MPFRAIAGLARAALPGQVTPNVAIDGRAPKLKVVRRTAVDVPTTRHLGYRASQIWRKRIEEVLGWIKTQAGLAKVKVRGRTKVEAAFHLHRLRPDPHSRVDSKCADPEATPQAPLCTDCPNTSIG
jgi:hypothetical protein